MREIVYGKNTEVKYKGQLAITDKVLQGQFGYEYSIIFLEDGNSLAWVDHEDLEFVSDGGEHLLDIAKKNKEEYYKKQIDLKVIKQNFLDGKGDKISTYSILHLFDKIGFHSSFIENGEFYILFSDWNKFEPIFELAFRKNKVEMEHVIECFFGYAGYNYLEAFDKFYDEVCKLD